MAYSVLSKEGQQGGIIHFLADTDKDIIFIIDDCNAGSTISVLKEKPHTYMKAPSGKWILVNGDSDYQVPFNNAEVEVPKADAKFSDKTAADLQENMVFYKTGLVTGTLKKSTYPAIYTEEDKKNEQDGDTGHFFCANLKTPPKATEYNMVLNEETTVKVKPVDDWVMVCMEHIQVKDKTKTVRITYDSGESFTFNLDHVDLE